MQDETMKVAGLAAPASITVDRYGVPHIRAENLDDLFFVQGFNAARDRLWQLDLWRKRGLGLLAADYGPGYLEQDRAARLFLYRGDMAAEWAAYSPDAEAICTRFVAGINAYVALCEREPGRLPPEFAAMGVRPARWAASDVVRVRSHSLMRNALSEVIRSNVLAKLDARADTLRQKLEPPHDPLADLDGPVEPLPIDCLDVFKLALAPASFAPERLSATLDEAARWRQVTAIGTVIRQSAGEGSNNWVVHGSRTETGRPILANDPHRMHALPSLRYVVHLSAPEFDGIGAGEPALPGLCIGHNGTAAFGLTLFFGHDQEDVYVYETHPDDPELYRYGAGWERMRVIGETIETAGHGEVPAVLKFTRHGAIVAEYPERRLAVAIRSVWFEPGAAPYFRSIATMRTTRFEEFRAGMAGWSVPATNQVYADTNGDVGWVVAGFSPVRPNWDGLLPVPGDGRFEWAGFEAELPWCLNPDVGHFATANEMNLPADWPRDNPIGYEWLEPSRAQRIAHAFTKAGHHTLADSMALQTDAFSMPAQRLGQLIEGLAGRTDAERTALGLLAAWDHVLAAGSGPAALFEVWWSRHLRPAMIARAVPDPALRPLFAAGDPAGMLDALEVFDGSSVHRETLLLDTLGAAVADVAALLGPDTAAWSWCALHKALFEHPVGAVRPDLKPDFDIGPFGVGGSDSSPMNMSYRPGDFRLTIGASFRIVVDVGDWDRSVFINTPGQSGDPRSPHYGDLAPIWAAGGYHPLLYSREAIEAAALFRIDLAPG
ncbi:penicillin amidase [Kaistia hirudinis]|uniref:Penicillin amidase n=1 Tax=Kaistia hirudinis TaxID=1293440 RepID=A0A840B021_9HYPH|nr:penicillin acylase family protein [Kaistia hirudinis]MBB3933776.1 penicillin amidase [Kaistia hirudinis]